ncbi:hypothetical protein KCP73_01525 [Salmonella enterica subsp. enterica]|nr:hypothetical protein KCP73_01525 [Salmonella enterica subsp. enterica]
MKVSVTLLGNKVLPVRQFCAARPAGVRIVAAPTAWCWTKTPRAIGAVRSGWKMADMRLQICERALNGNGGQAFTLSHCRRVSRRHSHRGGSFWRWRCGNAEIKRPLHDLSEHRKKEIR